MTSRYFGVIVDGAAELRLGGFGSGGVAFPDGGFGVDRAHVDEMESLVIRFRMRKRILRPEKFPRLQRSPAHFATPGIRERMPPRKIL